MSNPFTVVPDVCVATYTCSLTSNTAGYVPGPGVDLCSINGGGSVFNFNSVDGSYRISTTDLPTFPAGNYLFDI